MRHARLHPRILGYLGRALSLEYSAVQQYMAQAALADAWGLPEAASRFRHETVEELKHAERLIKRMLGLGVAPNASQLAPVALAGDLVGQLLRDARLEAEIVRLYEEATQFCQRIDEPEHAAFFEALWREELAHAEEIQDWLAALGVPQLIEDDRARF